LITSGKYTQWSVGIARMVPVRNGTLFSSALRVTVYSVVGQPVSA